MCVYVIGSVQLVSRRSGSGKIPFNRRVSRTISSSNPPEINVAYYTEEKEVDTY